MSSTSARVAPTLLKKAWREIPDVVAGTVLAVLGMGLGVGSLIAYYGRDGDNRRYKLGYVVMRDTDPRAQFVHKD